MIGFRPMKGCSLVYIACLIVCVADGCPTPCVCSEFTVKCVNKNLTSVPPGIPLSVRVLDLSENPSLKLEVDTFLRFPSLESLHLPDCNLNIAFELPRKLANIDLANNLLTLENVQQMFAGKESLIVAINLNGNSIQLDGKLSVFPKSTRFLQLDRNVLNQIQKDDFKRLKRLQQLKMRYSEVKSIDQGAFDALKELRLIWLAGNLINELPKRLFRFSPHLMDVDLGENNISTMPDFSGVRSLSHLTLAQNRIRTVNRYDFGFHSAFHIDLAGNSIGSFDFQGIKCLKLDLSNNQISNVFENSFCNNSRYVALLLQRNKLKNLSAKSFQGISYISELHLQGNYLQTLPVGLFRNISIRKLLLFSNNLTNMDGVLDGMKRQPNLLALFDNPIQSIQTSHYQHMKHSSHIYITCKNFKDFSSPLILKAKVICSPFEDLVIHTSTTGLEGNGFDCVASQQSIGEFKCYPCKQGQYDPTQDHSDSRSCTDCPPGAFYQDATASTGCKKCRFGQYVPPEKAPGKDPLDCITCPEGSNTNTSAGYRACRCLPGYSRRNRFGGCEKCNQLGFGCERDYPELKQGYWLSWIKLEACKASFKAFMSNLDTEDDSYHRATMSFECDLPTAHKCPMANACEGGADASCADGYTGVLCAVCQSGYMKQFKQCVPCSSPAVSATQCAAYLFLFVLLCWLMSKLDKMKLEGDSNKAHERTFADLIQSSVKILMGFYQVLIRIIEAFSSIRWPNALTHAVKAFEFIQFSVLRLPSLHCMHSDWRINAIDEFWISLIAMVTIPLVILLYFSLASFISYCRFTTGNFKEKVRKSSKNCLQSVVLFFFATYPLISTNIFHMLPASCHTFCTAKSDAKCIHSISYLRNDYSVECPVGANNTQSFSVTYAYISLLLPLGFPCLLLYLLWKFAPKGNMTPKETDEEENSNERLLTIQASDYLISEMDESPDRQEHNVMVNGVEESLPAAALKMTYGNYKASCWYWEFIEMIRKLLINIASSFLLQNVKIGLYGSILLSIIFVVLHAKIWPMNDSFDNYMQLLALVSVTLNLCYSVTRTSTIGDADILKRDEDEFALGLMLVTLNSSLFLLIAGRFIKEIALTTFAKLSDSSCLPRCCSSCCNRKENFEATTVTSMAEPLIL